MREIDSDAIACVEVLTSVVFLLEGAPEEMRNPIAVQSHLDTCLACQAEVMHEQAMKSLMREVLRRSCDEKAPEDLQNSIQEQLLIQMLEALEPREAIIFINMILKNLKIKGLDAKIVKEAFPGLLPE